MAASLLAHEVSDICIGKPPLRSLPLSATVGESLLSLKLCSMWAEGSSASPPSSGNKGSLAAASCAGKVCMVDVICYLCKEENLANPSAALRLPRLRPPRGGLRGPGQTCRSAFQVGGCHDLISFLPLFVNNIVYCEICGSFNAPAFTLCLRLSYYGLTKLEDSSGMAAVKVLMAFRSLNVAWCVDHRIKEGWVSKICK